MNYTISTKKKDLNELEFIEISQSLGWGVGKTYDVEKVKKALQKSNFIITVRDENKKLIACARVISDAYFFSTIPDIFVRKNFQGLGLGKLMMQEIIKKYGHTKIFLGSKIGNEGFFEKLGFQKDLQSYGYKK